MIVEQLQVRFLLTGLEDFLQTALQIDLKICHATTSAIYKMHIPLAVLGQSVACTTPDRLGLRAGGSKTS